MGDLDRALECYDQACATWEKVGNRAGAGATRLNRARVLLERDDPAEAYAVLEGCLDRALESGDRWNEAMCHPLMGRALLQLGRTAEAERHFESGLEILADLGLRYPEAEALLFLALLRLDHGRFREAAGLLHRALRIARETGSNALRYRAHHALAELHEALGRTRHALRHHRLYDKWRELVMGSETDRRLTAMLMRAETEETAREAEIHRLRHVELAQAVTQLEEANARLEEANTEKGRLLNELKERARELDRMAREDALTGLANRREMAERLETEYVRARRFDRDLTAVMVDADRFKQVNDRFSHAVGDEVLRQLAHVLAETCRAVDSVGRSGRRGVPDSAGRSLAERRGAGMRKGTPGGGELPVGRNRRGPACYRESRLRYTHARDADAGGPGRRRRCGAVPREAWRPQPRVQR